MLKAFSERVSKSSTTSGRGAVAQAAGISAGWSKIGL
jgi:hypothetical protein